MLGLCFLNGVSPHSQCGMALVTSNTHTHGAFRVSNPPRPAPSLCKPTCKGLSEWHVTSVTAPSFRVCSLETCTLDCGNSRPRRCQSLLRHDTRTDLC